MSFQVDYHGHMAFRETIGSFPTIEHAMACARAKGPQYLPWLFVVNTDTGERVALGKLVAGVFTVKKTEDWPDFFDQYRVHGSA